MDANRGGGSCWCLPAAPPAPVSVLVCPKEPSICSCGVLRDMIQVLLSLLLDKACEQSCEKGRGSFTRDPENHEVTSVGVIRSRQQRVLACPGLPGHPGQRLHRRQVSSSSTKSRLCREVAPPLV